MRPKRQHVAAWPRSCQVASFAVAAMATMVFPMIRVQHLGVFGFALVLVSACSNGTGARGEGSTLGGSTKNTTCKNTEVSSPRTPADMKCDTCGAQKCSSQAGAVLGSDPNAFGGACGPHQQCVCDCDAKDQTCETKCDARPTSPGSPSQCDVALAALISCLDASCHAECASS